MEIHEATVSDAQEILDLQKAAFHGQGVLYGDFTLPPLVQTLPEMIRDFRTWAFLKAIQEGRIVGSIRGRIDGDTCHVSRLIVHPDHQNRGIGKKLMRAIEERFPMVHRYELFTGEKSERNIALYEKLGYRKFDEKPQRDTVTLICMEKRLERRPREEGGRAVTCRRMTVEEASQAFSLVERSFNEFVRLDCSREGIGEFFRAARRMLFDRPAGHRILVAAGRTGVVGVLCLRDDGHISLFFVDRTHQGQGIGRTLLEEAVKQCEPGAQARRVISVNSSLHAVPIYEKLGFCRTQPVQTVNGIAFVEMKRSIGPNRKGAGDMPLIRVDIGRQGMTTELKRQLIERLTETAVEVTHIPRNAFSVIINEHDDANYGVGGLTLDKVRKP